MPFGPERTKAIATRPVVGSVPIAGRTSSRPLVTAVGADQVAPSGDVATKTAFLRTVDDSQACHVAQTRPVASTSAAGSGKARKPWTAQPLSTSATRTDGAQVAPPSVERDEAIDSPPASNRYTTT